MILIAASLRDRVDDAALEITMLGAGAESLDVERVDPVDTEREEIAADPGMVHGDAIELIVVRDAAGAAPELLALRARHEREQRGRRSRARQQLCGFAIESHGERRRADVDGCVEPLVLVGPVRCGTADVFGNGHRHVADDEHRVRQCGRCDV